jgi:hypothetical protein
MARYISTLLVIAAIGLVGCGKDDTASKPGENPLHAPADYVGALDKAQQTAIKTVDVASINQAIQTFEGTEGRPPQSLDELVSKKYLKSVPAPPRGMKFEYDAAKGTVKVVPQ